MVEDAEIEKVGWGLKRQVHLCVLLCSLAASFKAAPGVCVNIFHICMTMNSCSFLLWQKTCTTTISNQQERINTVSQR